MGIGPANICLGEDVSSRHLDQDEYVRLSLKSSEDVFKTSWSRPIYSSWPYVFKTSSRRFEDVIKTFPKRFQDVFKTSSRRFEDVLQRRLLHVFKTSCKNVFKTSSRRFEDIFKTFWKDIFRKFSRHIIKLNCSC